ncbi:acyl carrier protein [Archangium violaceum]|jgi:polyketide biosynthesis acyl carrier protein|uniref:acyl carrier protein n=1 Tax=Archangium violaceum TaxID=83451 RepID=UPI001951A6A9|nr:acyl carrier protein [Archangium violaceum]QRN93159.1 acyl carrier protein [Archangium violaceum]UQK84959.1 hypothetical protein [Archangium gephyra]
MTKNEIFEVVKKNILEVLSDVSADQIRVDCQLKDLGANSIDRVEITTMSMEALGINIPLVDLAGVSNIQGLVDQLYEKSQSKGSR